MDEIKIIENYNAGVSEIVSLIKETNRELTNHINSLTLEIKALREENVRLLARNIQLETTKWCAQTVNKFIKPNSL